MVISLNGKEVEVEDILEAFKKLGKPIKLREGKRPLMEHFGALERGIDGVQYQREARNEWD